MLDDGLSVSNKIKGRSRLYIDVTFYGNSEL
jgi:hypothetical protein